MLSTSELNIIICNRISLVLKILLGCKYISSNGNTGLSTVLIICFKLHWLTLWMHFYKLLRVHNTHGQYTPHEACVYISISNCLAFFSFNLVIWLSTNDVQDVKPINNVQLTSFHLTIIINDLRYQNH